MTYVIAVYLAVMMIPLGLIVGTVTEYSPFAGLAALVAGVFAIVGGAMLFAAVL